MILKYPSDFIELRTHLSGGNNAVARIWLGVVISGELNHGAVVNDAAGRFAGGSRLRAVKRISTGREQGCSFCRYASKRVRRWLTLGSQGKYCVWSDGYFRTPKREGLAASNFAVLAGFSLTIAMRYWVRCSLRSSLLNLFSFAFEPNTCLTLPPLRTSE